MFDLTVNLPGAQAVHALKLRAVGPDGRVAWEGPTDRTEEHHSDALAEDRAAHGRIRPGQLEGTRQRRIAVASPSSKRK